MITKPGTLAISIPLFGWLNPKHWPLALGLGLLKFGAFLPLSWSQRLGRGLGLLAYAVLPSRRRIVARNLQLCFPQWSAKKCNEMVRANFKASGMGLIEGGIAWWAPTRILQGFTYVEGMEHYEAARKAGRGVLVLGAHFTAMELAGRIAAMHFPVSTVYKPAKNQQFNSVMLTKRSQYFQSLIANDNLRGMLQVLNSGGVCWYGVDQDFGVGQGVFAPFFGVPTATLTLASKIVQRTGAKVLFGYPQRLPNAQGYVLHILPVEDFATGDMLHDATTYNRMIENSVIEAPEDYFWLHRRFKTRPEGEANPYD
ncbi:MAG: lipid A biosynthesis acyltransferase [Pseudomonadota bacterium]